MNVRKDQKVEKGRVYGGISREERVAQRREQFLNAGLEVFGTAGFRCATVRRLCSEAKLTDRYFYESFANIEALLIAVYTHQMDLIQDQLLASAPDSLAANDMESFIVSTLDLFFSQMEDSRIARVCMLEVEGVSPEVDALYNANIMRFAQLLMNLGRQLYPDWEISDDEREMVGIALIGAIRQTTITWILGGYRQKRQTLVAATARIFKGLVDDIKND